jgi:nucleotide-binding universal stress UspA family protein
MSVKSILVLSLDADANGSPLHCASKIARRFGAHISVTHIKAPPNFATGGGFGLDSGLPSESLLREFEASETERETLAHAAFQEFVEREALSIQTTPKFSDEVSANWNVLDGSIPYAIGLQGSAYDLIIAAHPRNGVASQARIMVETALFSTCRPVLIAPLEPPETLGDTVLVGWNSGAHAARALHAAKALILESAQRVHLFSVATGAKSGPSTEDIAANLIRNGITAEVSEIQPDHRSVGEIVLAKAEAIGADLVVLGAYSHSRLLETILGGVTQHVITNANVPVFMAH